MYHSDHVKQPSVYLSLSQIIMIIVFCGSLTGMLRPEYAVANEVERRKTVFFEANQIGTIDGNPFVHLDAMVNGFHQAMIEPLFILNYETGEIEPWLGVSMTANQALDEWTLTLRQGVAWNDGEAFTADDVVFTVRMLLKHAPDLTQSASLKCWVKQVEKVDDLTVRFTLTAPDPRFQLNFWAVKIRESVYIVPQAGTLLPFDTTYWIGWPTAANNYIQPPVWWQSTHKILHHLQPVP